MRWQRLTTWIALLLAWAVLAAWQWQEFGREREAARETLRRQADALMKTLVGGVRFHLRRGLYFEDQLQGNLEVLVESKDILAVAIVSDDGRRVLSAGQPDLLGNLECPIVKGEFWDEDGLRLVTKFRLLRPPDRPGADRGGLGRRGGPAGRGGFRGRGGPGRRGPGPGPAWQEEPGSSFWAGGQFAAVLILDGSQVDAQCRGAAWLRASVVAAGGLVLVCLGLAWRATVRLAEARGHARLLETEARHLRELSQAAAGLAHETRNPLGLIRGWTQRLAQSGLESPEQRQQAHAVVEECDRVTARINQFLAFAKPCEPQLEPVGVAELADELAALLEPDLDAGNLTLDRSAVAASQTIRADREMLRQALFNLVQNAVQSSPAGGTVEMAVRRGQDGRKRIEVTDGGPGVPADAVQSLFTPYFTTRRDGTGLGLAVVRRIATAHDWKAGYSPRPGGGSIFWLDGIDG
ncbi:MAG: ATP-binding protein [Planctomycetota bacterium]|jgi:signal transduction histidine kinase